MSFGYISRFEKSTLLKRAKAASTMVLSIAVLQLLLTIVVPVGPYTNPHFLYLRNYSSVGALLILALHLRVWGGKSKYQSIKKLKMFKLLTLLAALACYTKFVLVLSYFVVGDVNMDLVGVYYASELVVWLGMAVFLTYYFILLLPCRIREFHHTAKDVNNFL